MIALGSRYRSCDDNDFFHTRLLRYRGIFPNLCSPLNLEIS